MTSNPVIGIVGATGAVGQILVSVLGERTFPAGEVRCFASSSSKGKKLVVCGKEVEVQELSLSGFDDCDIVFFDIPDDLSKQWVPVAAKAGAFVVDNSAAWRLENGPLVIVPEVNGVMLEERLKSTSELEWKERIFCCPNCSTAQLVVALIPIERSFGLKKVIVSTYQSVSGAGYLAIDELKNQVASVLAAEANPDSAKNSAVAPQSFSHQIAFNCIPQIGGIGQNGFTSEEMKIINESRLILNLPNLQITATAVRVPVDYCHGESIFIETAKDFSLNEVFAALGTQAGLRLLLDSEHPMPINARNEDAVLVGRVRKDEQIDRGLHLWVVADNLRKGAALNAVQIAEALLKSK